MSAEYSVEEVLEEAANCPHLTKKRAMLEQLAERIEADERAVPVAHLSRFIDGNRMDSSTIGMDRAAYKLPYGDYPLFTYPPAQAAPVKPRIIATLRKGAIVQNVDFTSEGGAEIEFRPEGIFVGPAADFSAHPNPPDAADSGRVTIDFGSIGSAGPFSIINGKVTLPDVTLVDLVHRMQPTLAAQGQGEIDLRQYVRNLTKVLEAGVGMWTIDADLQRLAAAINANLPAPPASPAGVPDVQEKYDELILSVGNKYRDETRHETALRYIKQAEQQSSIPCAAAAPSATPEGGEVGL